MTDFLNFLPLFPTDDEGAILGRMIDWANEGLDPAVDVDRWVDTREGGHWRLAITPNVREFARMYDVLGTEVIAASMPLWSWGQYLDDQAEVYDVFRVAGTRADGTVTFTGTAGDVIVAGTTLTVEAPDESTPTPEFQTVADVPIGIGGTVDAVVVAVDAGAEGNVAADALTVPSTPLPPGTSVTNAAATTGGTDPQDDEGLLNRLLGIFAFGQASGTMGWYAKTALDHPGVGFVTVIPLWAGPGTVKVIVTGPDGSPAGAGTVADLQAAYDPGGVGVGGVAPINHIVTVDTAVVLNIDVAATVDFEAGYAMTDSAGAVGLQDAIIESVRTYIASVPPGGEVVVQHVAGAIVTIEGVHDVTAVQLNGAGINVPVDDDPAQVPRLHDTTGIV